MQVPQLVSLFATASPYQHQLLFEALATSAEQQADSLRLHEVCGLYAAFGRDAGLLPPRLFSRLGQRAEVLLAEHMILTHEARHRWKTLGSSQNRVELQGMAGLLKQLFLNTLSTSVLTWQA
ncbi:hypothetical protein HaLaN_07932 [Haematococcus lacustris]|uniref:Uncharacterized protein n=1 Tax=Haematococcus lacustris TaxID=44745 RepID=A0A699Z057_HAELA|nr:hypothetical protein HaLaN_07932 [Haematococcus lacustris]